MWNNFDIVALTSLRFRFIAVATGRTAATAATAAAAAAVGVPPGHVDRDTYIPGDESRPTERGREHTAP